jgi:glycosyltransferase involved in cell wall biosynthesis
MKIALGLEYPLKLRGGVGVLVEKLIEGVREKHEVVLVSPDPPGSIFSGTSGHVHWNPDQVSAKTSEELARRLADLGVSLAHLHLGGNYGWGSRILGQSPFPFLRRRGIAAVSTVHMVLSIFDGYCDSKKSFWFKCALLPFAWLGKLDTLRNLNAEIVVSKGACERLKRWYWPFKQKFRAIYHSRLPDAPPPEASGRESLIIAVGHIAFRKGQHTLAAAFARIAAAHPTWKLALIGPVGDTGCRAQIETIISAHRLQNQILLPGSREDAADYMRRAAILVQPSFYEGLPLALQEGMFYGCAAVATRVIGNEELIRDGTTGLLVPPDDPDALALALSDLIKDPAKREKLGRAAVASVIEQGMTATKMVEQHLALYDLIGHGIRVGG